MKSKPKDPLATVALCVSLVLHVCAAAAMLQWQASQTMLAGLFIPPARVEAPTFDPIAIERLPLIEPLTGQTLSIPLPAPIRLPDETNVDWGEKGGRGTAITASPGDRPMSTPHKGHNDQSFASRDPQGPGPIPEVPSPSVVHPGTGGNGPPIARVLQLAPAGDGGAPMEMMGPKAGNVAPTPPVVERRLPPGVMPAAPRRPVESASAGDARQILPGEEVDPLAVGDAQEKPTIVEALTAPPGEAPLAGESAPLPDLVALADPAGPEIRDAIVPFEVAEPLPEPMAQRLDTGASAGVVAVVSRPSPRIQQPQPQPHQNNPGIPGPMIPAADAAADLEFESDPFSKLPGVVFRNGKVEARSGRKVKPIRPRLTLAGQQDLLSFGFPTVVLKVRIDRAGKVIDVKVIRGAGSEAIDMPVYRAMWGWWFEPPVDKDGNPLPDVQLVTIHWG